MKAHVYSQMAGLMSFVEANLPTYLDEVETEIGITIADPAEHVLGYRETLSANHYPALFYVAAWANPDPSAQGAQWLPLAVDLELAYKDSDPEVLEKALLGYADAFINLFGENESIGGNCDLAEITYLDWYHGAPGSKDMGLVVVSITMRSEILT